MRAVRERDGGFTLVEVLVALLVLAVGLLGAAALLLESLRISRSGLARTQAVALAADIAERLQANRSTASAYDCAGTCEPGEGGDAVAIEDLDDWRESVAARLAGAAASVTLVPGAPARPAVYVIVLDWVNGGSGAGSGERLRLEVVEAAP